MRVLVSGATGLVGPRLADRLLAQGDFVRLLVPPEAEDGFPRAGIEIVPDVEDSAAEEALTDIDVVYDLGSLLMGTGFEDRSAAVRTARLVTGARSRDVGRFVYLSSVAVYAPAPRPWMWPIREDAPLLAHGHKTLRLFGQEKIEAERLLRRVARKRFEFTILRSSAVYGPGARWLEGLLRGIANDPFRGLGIELNPTFMQWLNVRDLVDALVLAATREPAANATFNVASRDLFTRRDVAKALSRVERHLLPKQSGHARLLKYDISRARAGLGFESAVTLEQGLAEVVAAIRFDGIVGRASWTLY
jgi:nucleoside-diphosphate-sugar epimerase